jgi:hypothetical protein
MLQRLTKDRDNASHTSPHEVITPCPKETKFSRGASSRTLLCRSYLGPGRFWAKNQERGHLDLVKKVLIN